MQSENIRTNAEIVASLEAKKRLAGLEKTTMNYDFHKEELFHLIQKENLILQQYHDDLAEKLVTYDRKYDFDSPKVEWLTWINRYLFWFYMICVLIFAYFVYMRVSWTWWIKVVVILVLTVYPFYVYKVEYWLWDYMVYMYCLFSGVKYVKPTKYAA